MKRHTSAVSRTAFLTATGTAAATAFALVGWGLAVPSPAQAHGYVGGPGATLVTRAAMPANASLVGNARWEPQSLEAPKGWPSAPDSPADGMIASAGGAFGGLLDRQTPNLWAKQNINPGVNKIVWNYTAPHKTAGDTLRRRKELLVDTRDPVVIDLMDEPAYDEIGPRSELSARAALATLPDRWKVVLWAMEVEGRSRHQVARILGLSPVAVSALALRARMGLRRSYLALHRRGCRTGPCDCSRDARSLSGDPSADPPHSSPIDL